MAITKLVAGPQGDAGNSKGSQIAQSVNELIDESVLVRGDVTTLQTDSTSLRTDVDGLIDSVSDLSVNVKVNSQLKKLNKSLNNPLHQFLGITLIGDSITWGMTVTGGLPVDPRNGTLTDTRNNGTSPSWSNLLHKYLGNSYYSDDSAVEAAWPTSQGGVVEFSYSKEVDLFPAHSPIKLTAEGTSSWGKILNASAVLGHAMDGRVVGNDEVSLSFQITGKSFSIVHAVLGDGAICDVYVNNTSIGTIDSNSTSSGLPISFGNVATFNFDFVKDADVKIVVRGGDSNADLFRVESVRINRQLRVTNQGIIGTNTRAYYFNGILQSAVRSDDSFSFIQLGTNDRGEPATNGGASSMPTSPSSVYRNLSLIIDYLNSVDVEPILMCANAVVNNTRPPYFYDMSSVRSEISRLARDKNISFIDNFAKTQKLIAAGDTTWLADGLHPNDDGHNIIFENITDSIDKAL
jgi:lysophospholipase L1-like esterase